MIREHHVTVGKERKNIPRSIGFVFYYKNLYSSYKNKIFIKWSFNSVFFRFCISMISDSHIFFQSLINENFLFPIEIEKIDIFYPNEKSFYKNFNISLQC